MACFKTFQENVCTLSIDMYHNTQYTCFDVDYMWINEEQIKI